MLRHFEGWLQAGSIQSQTGRVFTLFGALVLILGAIALVGSLRMQQRSTDLATLTDVAFLTNEMTRNVTLSKNNMGAYHARGRSADRMQLAVTHAEAAVVNNKDLRVLLARLDRPEAERMDNLDAGLQDLLMILEEMRNAPDEIVDTEPFIGPKYDRIDTVVEDINEVSTLMVSQVERYAGEGQREIQILIALLVVGVLGGLALVLLGKRLVLQRVTEPIAAISSASERIAKGETELEIPGESRGDEIGTMASALNVLRQVQREASDQAARELERERKAQQEREEQRRKQSELLISLADQFEQTVGDVAARVAAASQQMHGAAVELSEHVEASTNTMSEANATLKQASAGLTGAASASDEFALSINEVSRQAGSSSDRARKAAEAASKADQTVTGLTDSATRISTIIEVIAGIAQRTNLLALNASIEAARGGEAGRGFAVVASEVKELAIQTGRATEEVEGLIREMQAATGDSVAALKEISDEVVALDSIAMAIAVAVDQQATAGQDLAKSIDVAARNTEAVSATIDNVSQVSTVSGATASGVREEAASLSAQASVLREQVARFLSEVRAA